MSERWQAIITLAVIYIVALVPITIGTVAHLRENKRLFGKCFPAGKDKP